MEQPLDIPVPKSVKVAAINAVMTKRRVEVVMLPQPQPSSIHHPSLSDVYLQYESYPGSDSDETGNSCTIWLGLGLGLECSLSSKL